MLPLDPSGPYAMNEAGAEFEDPKVRRRFVSRVFGLISLQLAFTAAFVAICLFVKDLREWVKENDRLGLIAFIVYVVAMFAFVFGRRFRRGPFGYLCLVVVTVSMAYLAAHFSVVYSNWTALFAASFTANISLTICLVAACTHFDLTRFRGFVAFFTLIGILCLLILIALRIPLPDHRWLELLGASVGALLLSMMLLYEVQTIMGGRVIAMKPDELVYATSMVYVQMIVLYHFLLGCKFA